MLQELGPPVGCDTSIVLEQMQMIAKRWAYLIVLADLLAEQFTFHGYIDMLAIPVSMKLLVCDTGLFLQVLRDLEETTLAPIRFPSNNGCHHVLFDRRSICSNRCSQTQNPWSLWQRSDIPFPDGFCCVTLLFSTSALANVGTSLETNAISRPTRSWFGRFCFSAC